MRAHSVRRVRFDGAGGQALVARVVPPVGGAARAWCLFAHCFTCGKDLGSARRLGRALAARGIGVVRFDFTGIGESEGDFAETDFASNLDDLVAAADWMREELAAPRLLLGHSLGGAAVIAAARRIPESTAVATIGAPSETSHLRELLAARAPALAHGRADEAEIELGGRPFRIRRSLLDDLDRPRMREALERLDRALLILHSTRDEVVGIDHARRIYEAARHPKSFVSLDRADHLLLNDRRDAVYAAEVLAAWASRYVEDAGERADEATEAEEGVVVVSGGPDGYTQRVVAAGHQLLADEPERLGGDAAGPTPYDFLLAALGACTSMTLRMYADRKKWPLRGVRVRLTHDRMHASDCESCATREGRVDRIRLVLEVTGDLDAEQRRRLLEIAGRCPVKRTLESETVIESELAE